MIETTVILEFPPALRRPMTSAQNERKLVAGDRLAHDPWRERRGRQREGEIERAALQSPMNVAAVGFEAKINQRRFTRQTAHDWRSEQNRLNVGRRDAQDSAFFRGVEWRRRKDRLETIERSDDLRRQRLRLRSQRKAFARANEEWVPKQVPQPRERATHGRLAQPDVLGGARDIAPPQQGVERRQEIEINAR